MLARLAAGVVLAGALALTPLPGLGVAAAAAPAPAPAPTQAARGALVVAVSDDAAPPARALAREVYRDAALRPAIDDATARVLTGEAPPALPAHPKLTEMAEVRASIAGAGSEVASRRLLASLGTETSSALVLAVRMEAGRPVAKVLQVSSATYERIELGATIETATDGARSFLWPGAATTLKGLLPNAAPPRPALPPKLKPAVAAPPPPPRETPKESKPVWSSPWFWGTLGGVAAVGITVFVLAQTTGAPDTVHLDGRVVP
jgi:hypothetical protein